MSQINPPVPPYPSNVVMSPTGPVIVLTFGQILERIFTLLRANLRAFLGIGALPLVVLFGFEGVFLGGLALAGVIPHGAAAPNSAAAPWIVIPAFVFFVPLALLFYGLYFGASTFAALHADANLKVTAGQAIGHGWSRLSRYTSLIFFSSVLIALPLIALAAVAGLLALLLGVTHNADGNTAALFVLIPLGVLAYLGYIVYAVYMTMRLSLAFPACVHEGITALQAIRRSGVLTRGAKGRIFLAQLVIHAISSAAAMVLYVFAIFVFVIVAAAGGDKLHDPSPITIALLVLGGLVMLAFVLAWSALLMGANSLTFAIFYRDQRLRQEGVPAPGAAPASSSAGADLNPFSGGAAL